jgi:branched-chain amino acid transport system substrate-binding protein
MKAVVHTFVSLLAAIPVAVYAQIIVGQTAGTTGEGAGRVAELNKGVELAFTEVNAAGGIRGNKLQLRVLDDQRDGKKAAQNVRTLSEQGAVALLLSRSTVVVEAIMPELLAQKIPLVGPATGANSLHSPVHPYLFNVRASFSQEAAEIVRQLEPQGASKIAVIYQDDAFGKDGASGAINEIKKNSKLTLTAEVKFPRAQRNFENEAELVRNSDLAIVVGGPEPTAAFVKALRLKNGLTRVATLSNNASDSFVKDLGTYAQGVMVNQIVPDPKSAKFAMTNNFRTLAFKNNVTSPSPAVLEGYLAAKVLIESMRRVRGPITAQSITDSLNRLDKFDLGGLVLGYSETDHTGLRYSDLSIIGKTGQFLR